MKGFAPVIIVIIVALLIGAGVGGYIIIAQRKTIFQEQPATETQVPPEPSSVIGLWRQEKESEFNFVSQRWEEKTPDRGYLEFKEDGTMCIWNDLSATGKLYTCFLEGIYTIAGDKLTTALPTGADGQPQSSTGLWRIVKKKLELTSITRDSTTGESIFKTVSLLRKIPYPDPKETERALKEGGWDPRLLIGIWRSPGGSPDYLEFKDREVCKRGSYSAKEGFRCSELYLPYGVEGYFITLDLAPLQELQQKLHLQYTQPIPSQVRWGWRITDDELELSIGTYVRVK